MVNFRSAAIAATVAAVLAACAGLAGAATPAGGPLAASLPHRTLAAGQTVQVKLTDRGHTTVGFGLARPLQRRVRSRWVPVTTTHGRALAPQGLNIPVGAVSPGAPRTLAV